MDTFTKIVSSIGSTNRATKNKIVTALMSAFQAVVVFCLCMTCFSIISISAHKKCKCKYSKIIKTLWKLYKTDCTPGLPNDVRKLLKAGSGVWHRISFGATIPTEETLADPKKQRYLSNECKGGNDFIPIVTCNQR